MWALSEGETEFEKQPLLTHIEEEESEDALVRQDVEGVAGGAVDDRQAVHAVMDEQFDGIVQAGVRAGTD